MTKKDLELKILTLDPEKEYIIAIGANAGLSRYDLASMHVGEAHVFFMLVDDVNQIKLSGPGEIGSYMKANR